MKIYEDSDISKIKGVGEKKAEALRSIGINTVADLLNYFPSDYRNRGNFVSYAECAENELALIKASYTGQSSSGYAKKNYSKSTLVFNDGASDFEVIFYNQPYISSSLKKNVPYRLYGRFFKGNGGNVMISPQIERDDEATFLNEGLYPVYSIPVKSGIKQKEFSKYIQYALDNAQIYEDLPLWLMDDAALSSKIDSYDYIHSPLTKKEVYDGLRYFRLKEFLSFFIGINDKKDSERRTNGIKLDVKCISKMSELLEFKLTKAQLRTLKEILADLASGRQMNRLVQGDVGSGKTMVAVMASYVAAANGYQAAICAPTEILAKQHYKKYAKYFEAHGYKCGILYSGMKKELRDKMKLAIEKGIVKVVFGTHALFSQDVKYNNLALVTIDEQHRYGVAQRAALEGKGTKPHVLVMSATPIPRTLALCFYKDLDLSVIDELPAGRKPIKTVLINSSQNEKAYAFIRRCAEKGLKSFIVCPAIDAIDMENVSHVYAEAKEALAPHKVAFITGGMKETEKNAVMNQFASSDTNILVATSIVEVGIDVPTAVVMWIKGSERFGLAQLHQLRGRVGRSDLQSCCFLQTDSTSAKTLQRLNVMKNENDGLEIAKKDMEIRGAGEVFGFKQSGKNSALLDDAITFPELFMLADGLSERLKNSQDETDKLLYEELRSSSEKLSRQIALN